MARVLISDCKLYVRWRAIIIFRHFFPIDITSSLKGTMIKVLRGLPGSHTQYTIQPTIYKGKVYSCKGANNDMPVQNLSLIKNVRK